jgi:hypothetical protein
MLEVVHVPLARGGNNMTKQAIVAAGMAATMGLSGVAVMDVARADGIFNGMNPFNWFSDRDHDYYRDRWSLVPSQPLGPSIRMGRPLRLERALGLPRLRPVSDGDRDPRRIVGQLQQGGRGTSSRVGRPTHQPHLRTDVPRTSVRQKPRHLRPGSYCSGRAVFSYSVAARPRIAP